MGTNTVFREAPYKNKLPKKISIETFLRKYRKGGPGEKYEFNNGIIEKTEAMKFREQYLAFNIINHFERTKAAKKGAKLVQELEVWTSEVQWRKPDLCLVTLEQTRAAYDGFEPMPAFVIEVISPNDKITMVKSKVNEYFDAGVEVIWLIFPHNQSVEVYLSNSKQIEICTGDMVCSVEPFIEGFKIKASDIFKSS